MMCIPYARACYCPSKSQRPSPLRRKREVVEHPSGIVRGERRRPVPNMEATLVRLALSQAETCGHCDSRREHTCRTSCQPSFPHPIDRAKPLPRTARPVLRQPYPPLNRKRNKTIIASAMTFHDSFDAPARRSTNLMGTSRNALPDLWQA